MSTALPSEPVLSLAVTGIGQAVQIRRILFGALRSLCADLGVREGDVVRCRAGTASHLLLDTSAGRTVTLQRDWARFSQVNAPAQASGPVPAEHKKGAAQAPGTLASVSA